MLSSAPVCVSNTSSYTFWLVLLPKLCSSLEYTFASSSALRSGMSAILKEVSLLGDWTLSSMLLERGNGFSTFFDPTARAELRCGVYANFESGFNFFCEGWVGWVSMLTGGGRLLGSTVMELESCLESLGEELVGRGWGVVAVFLSTLDLSLFFLCRLRNMSRMPAWTETERLI